LLHTILIKSNESINLKDCLFSGQSFSWNIYDKFPDFYGSMIGVVPVFIRQLSEFELEVYSESTLIDGVPIDLYFRNYFSLEIDSNRIFPKSFSQKYPGIWNRLAGYFPLKILRQDFFETLVTFMCAQGIGMHLIRKQVAMLTQTYGEKRTVELCGTPIDLYSFPSPLQLAEADLHELSRCTNNNRIRAANISLAARAVAEGAVEPDTLRDPQLPLPELRCMLSRNPGIGYKIADCIALFGLGRFDAFPIDTHVKQYLQEWFNSATAAKSLSPANYLLLDREARAILNPDMAGFAGHILFHCWRSEIKKLRTF
jgi:N-glycosylase/DNA lyase